MLEKIEKKIGKYAIRNLIYYILGAYVVGYVLYMAKPEWYEYIVLYPSLVMKGQVWRLFTWVCTIPQSLSILLIFMFLFYFYIGKTLEQYMGAFRYNLYILSGWFFMTLGTMAVYWISGAISGPSSALTISASTYYINLTSFLAFAVIFPDSKVLLFAVLPIKMKILAWIDAIYLALQVISGLVVALAPTETVSQALQLYFGYPPTSYEVSVMRQSSVSLVISILISVMNFLIFFLANAKKRAENRKRREDFQKKMQQRSGAFGGYRTSEESGNGEGNRQETTRGRFRAADSGTMVHKCSICGRTNIDHPELMFRYCSKCSGNHEYCQDHLFTHEHVK